MISVLFVCLGNICRSPMAEAVFGDMVRVAGLEDRVTVDSAGTGNWHIGHHPHPGTLQILKRHGIPEGSRARQITVADLEQSDYVIVMDESNRKNVMALASKARPCTARIHLLLEFAPEVGEREVPDPYFTGEFEGIFTMVTAGCAGLLREIRKTKNL